MSEKPFDATPGKLRRARQKGDVPKSTEITAIVSFTVAGGCAVAVGPAFFENVGNALRIAARGEVPAGALVQATTLAFVPLGTAALTAVAVTLAQFGGPIFAAPSFKLERLRPDTALKRMFGPEGAVPALRGLAVLAVALGALVPVARAALATAPSVGGSPVALALFARDASLHAIAAVLAVGALGAGFDLVQTRARWKKQQRMDRDELRREHRENEGDPHLKAKRTAAHRERMRGSVEAVRRAAFVVTNPTHIAVALEYRPPDVAVPRVLVMGADESAAEIRARARALGVPLVENVPLARQLWAEAAVGRPVPRESFIALAEIVVALTRSTAS